MASLAVKYRPIDFKDVCSQDITIKILEKQLEMKKYPNCYLFWGCSGVGKTTIARILANKINNNQGTPEEIDGASNNGVDNVRALISSAKERSLDSEYKIIIIDECHAISSNGWQAFLKCLEEPPKYTIFMFCTTDPQKIPATIQNRMMSFNLNPIPHDVIENRLKYICEQEGFSNYNDSIKYVSKISNGSMRTAIADLEKIVNYSKDLNINTTTSILGNYSYDMMFDLTNNIIDSNDSNILSLVDSIFKCGTNASTFIDQYLTFILNVTKYCITQDINTTTIPEVMLEKLKYLTGIENNISYFKWLSNALLDVREDLKFDVNSKTTLELKLINLCNPSK